jgi:S1-C subfamily serine protease
VRYFLGVSDRPSRLFLGVYVSSQQPCRLLSTDAKGLADKLGLRSGDTIVSAAGKAFHETDDIEGFKLVIEANLGRTIGVTVSRNGKPRVLSVKVPAEMPAAFLRGQRSAIWP